MNKIKIGLSISLTGDYSIQGIESFQGIKLWVSDANRDGGIFVKEYSRKLPIELVHYDDQSSVERCRANTEKLITVDEVNLLLGPYSSSLALKACEVAEGYNKTIWNHGGSTDEIQERDFRCVINAITPASNYSLGIIDLVRKTDPDAKNIATFQAENSGFSTRIARSASKYAQSLGLNVREYKFISGTKDFSAQLDDLEFYQPDLILGIGRAEDDLALAEQIFSRGLKSKAAGFIVASLKLFQDKFDKHADKILSVSQWEKGLQITPDTGPAPEEFANHFKSVYDREPDYVAAQGYNIGIIVQKCIGEVGTLNDSALREFAKSLELKTFYGTFHTDSNGNQIGHEMVVVQWQGGEKAIVYPQALAQSEIIYPR